MTKYPCPHERLDAWKVAAQALKVALQYTATLPPALAEERRQINKAAGSVVRNLGEGANRWRPLEKIHKFEIAEGEVGEAVAIVQALILVGLGEQALGAEFVSLESRVGAMTVGLIRRQRRR